MTKRRAAKAAAPKPAAAAKKKADAASKKRGRGQPTKYKAEYVEKARKLCEAGATDVDVADFFGVSVRTIYRWQSQHPEFCQALKVGKEPADDRVEASLFHRAVGYSYDAEKIFQFQGEVIRVPYREHVPPDTAAAFIWLKNRRPELWRDKQEIDHNHGFHELTDEQIAKRLQELIGKAGGGSASDG